MDPCPSRRELAAAIDAGNADALRNLARSYVDAAERLRSTPDPHGQRERSAITRLALLVRRRRRAAQASSVVAAMPRRRYGTSAALALVAITFGPVDLGLRRTGFDPALLTGAVEPPVE